MKKDMSRKIKELRAARGLTLEQVGTAVGVGKSTVRKWETGMIENMRRDKIAALAEVLGTSPMYLMGWEEKQETAPTPMTEAEAALLELFKRVPADKQNLVLGMIRAAIESQG